MEHGPYFTVTALFTTDYIMRPIEYRQANIMITGASSGIGLALAQALAARGANLILVACSAEMLRRIAENLARQHGVRAHAVVADLGADGAAEEVHAQACALGLTPHMLINNAGFATYGRFESLSLTRQLDEIALNCRAVVALSHAVLPAMLSQGHGAIINVASTAALQPLPYMAVYGATKAFVLSFSEALWQEYRDRGIRVLALCPGATDTAFFDVVGADEAAVGQRMSVDVVVNICLYALERGRSHVVAGRANRLLAWLPRLLPRQTVLRVVANMLKPRRQNLP